MDNWLLIIVATVFLICIAVGYIRGFLKFGLSLISTVLTLVIVAFLSPYVADALAKYTPVDDFIEQKFRTKICGGIHAGALRGAAGEP